MTKNSPKPAAKASPVTTSGDGDNQTAAEKEAAEKAEAEQAAADKPAEVAAKKSKGTTVQARVLSAHEIDGVKISPNHILEADEAMVLSLVKSGVVDHSPAAVKFALADGGKIVKID